MEQSGRAFYREGTAHTKAPRWPSGIRGGQCGRGEGSREQRRWERSAGRAQGDPAGLVGQVKCGFYSKGDGQPLKVSGEEKNDMISWWF